MRIPFTGQTSKAQARAVNLQETINWYPAKTSDGKSPLVLYPTPGLKTFGSIGAGPCRGMLETTQGTFAVYGSQLYKLVDPTGGILIGSLNTSSGTVSMDYNPTTMMIVDGTNGYYVDLTTPAVVQITDVDFPNGATHVVFIDGYFLVNDPDNAGRFNLSDSYATNPATSWTNGQYATAERSPDILKAVSVNHRTVYLHGATTTELWYNSGAYPFPFSPIPTGLIEAGMDAAFSVSKHEQRTVWLAKMPTGQIKVVAATGPQMETLSDEDMEYQLSTYSKTDDAVGWCYSQAGHAFYVLSFPTQDITWVYDFTTGAWHTRKSYVVGRWKAQWHAMLGNKHIVGDYNSGYAYQLDLDTYSDGGDPIQRERVTQHIHTDNDEWMFFSKVYLEFEHGVGDNTTTDPQVSLEWSDDHGNTWTNEMWRDLGAIGEYKTCAYFHMLGRSKDRVFRIKVSDPIKAVFLGGYADVRFNSEKRG